MKTLNFVSPQTLAVSIYYFIVAVGLLATGVGVLLLIDSFQDLKGFPSAIFVLCIGIAFDVIGYSIHLGKVDARKATAELERMKACEQQTMAAAPETEDPPKPAAPPQVPLRIYTYEKRALLAICGVKNGE